MKEALTLLFTKLAEWVGYPKTQLRELYAPLDLLMRDATTLFELYPEVMCAPEVVGKTSERRLRQAREEAEKVMDQALVIVTKMEELIRAKWDLVDRDDVPLFGAFLQQQVRLRNASPMALHASPEVVFDVALADRIRDKVHVKRGWLFARPRRRKPQMRLGMVTRGRPLPMSPPAPLAS